MYNVKWMSKRARPRSLSLGISRTMLYFQIFIPTLYQGSRLTFQLASPLASDRFDLLAKTDFSLATLITLISITASSHVNASLYSLHYALNEQLASTKFLSPWFSRNCSLSTVLSVWWVPVCLPRRGSWLGCQDLHTIGAVSIYELAANNGSSWISLSPNLHFGRQLLTRDMTKPVLGHKALTAIPSSLNSWDIPRTHRVIPYLDNE